MWVLLPYCFTRMEYRNQVGGAIRIGFGAGGYQLTGGKTRLAVRIVNVTRRFTG
ncbi:MAG: hypothetical protein ACLUFT_03455 [Gemmiger formicilis]|uniref:hypothetical protein n=1 Tax=Gemmiger formicilis TaxID=745368 RepID=UPI003992C187